LTFLFDDYLTDYENMKNLVLLDLRILLGADIPWAHVGKQPEAPPSDLATAALSQAGGDDDDSESSKSEVTFAGRAGLATGILRQHSLANAKTGESFTFTFLCNE